MREYFKTQVLPDTEKAAGQLAHDIVVFIEEKLLQQEYVFIALSGGNTPQMLFKMLNEMEYRQPDWSRVQFFWVDERCVPSSSQESNFGNADRLLFSRINFLRENLHPINGENDPAAETVRYAGEMRRYIPHNNGGPVFDIVLLGMGDDGHTASLFPGAEILPEESMVCAVSAHPLTGQKRITITERVINNAKEVIFLVTGNSKALPLKLIFENSKEASFLPAIKISPQNGHLSWYLDKASAALLTDPEH